MLQLKDVSACDQVRVAAAIIHNQNQQRATRAAVEMALRSPEVQRLVRGMIERNRRKPAYANAPSGLITRQQPDLRAMQAELRAMQKRDAELMRQVARERAGYR